LGLKCSTGIGKSHQLRKVAEKSIEVMRSNADNRCVAIFVSTQKLAKEQVDTFNSE